MGTRRQDVEFCFAVERPLRNCRKQCNASASAGRAAAEGAVIDYLRPGGALHGRQGHARRREFIDRRFPRKRRGLLARPETIGDRPYFSKDRSIQAIRGLAWYEVMGKAHRQAYRSVNMFFPGAPQADEGGRGRNARDRAGRVSSAGRKLPRWKVLPAEERTIGRRLNPGNRI